MLRLKPVVLDTNLVVSAFIQPHGTAAQALGIALREFDVVMAEATLAELADVLSRDKFDRYLDRAVRRQLLADYAEAARAVAVTQSVTDCRDPRDNKFLALALSAGARLIVSGDRRDLRSMSPWRGVEIVGVRAFVEGWEAWR